MVFLTLNPSDGVIAVKSRCSYLDEKENLEKARAKRGVEHTNTSCKGLVLTQFLLVWKVTSSVIKHLTDGHTFKIIFFTLQNNNEYYEDTHTSRSCLSEKTTGLSDCTIVAFHCVIA